MGECLNSYGCLSVIGLECVSSINITLPHNLLPHNGSSQKQCDCIDRVNKYVKTFASFSEEIIVNKFYRFILFKIAFGVIVPTAVTMTE